MCRKVFVFVRVYICVFGHIWGWDLCDLGSSCWQLAELCVFEYLCICVFVYLCIWVFVYLWGLWQTCAGIGLDKWREGYCLSVATCFWNLIRQLCFDFFIALLFERFGRPASYNAAKKDKYSFEFSRQYRLFLKPDLQIGLSMHIPADGSSRAEFNLLTI